MIRNIVRYLGLALVIVGIVLVMKNLFSSETNDWGTKKLGNSKVYYTANVKLLDNETEDYIVGASLVLKDADDKIIDEWKTTNKAYSVIRLEKGSYKLEQVKTIDGYEKSDKVITFEITDEDKNVIMYNTAVKEENKKVEKEVNVDNTSSMKNSLISILAVIISLVGVLIIRFPNVAKER